MRTTKPPSLLKPTNKALAQAKNKIEMPEPSPVATNGYKGRTLSEALETFDYAKANETRKGRDLITAIERWNKVTSSEGWTDKKYHSKARVEEKEEDADVEVEVEVESEDGEDGEDVVEDEDDIPNNDTGERHYISREDIIRYFTLLPKQFKELKPTGEGAGVGMGMYNLSFVWGLSRDEVGHEEATLRMKDFFEYGKFKYGRG